MANDIKQVTPKHRKSTIFAYFVGIFFILGGCGMIISGQILSGIFSGIAGLLALPIFWKFLKNKYSFTIPTVLKIITVIIAFAIIGITTPTPSTQNNQPTSKAVKASPAPTTPSYEIIETVRERSDGRRTFRVQIDPVNLTNDSFKADVKAIVADLVKKNGEKISVDIFDNRDSYDALIEKQDVKRGCIYDENGKNITNNEVVKACLEKLSARMESHYIAFYVGYLEEGNDHWLQYFPTAFNNSESVGKYTGTEDFNPSNHK